MSSQNSSKSSGIQRASASTSSSNQQTRSESGSIDVEIRGQRLSVRSDHDPAFVRRLASYLDSTLEELHEAAPAASMNKLLMLAGMTVAEELFETREQLDEMREQLDETSETMFELIDEVEDP